MNTLFLPIAFACFKVGGCMFYAPEPAQLTPAACRESLKIVREQVLNSKGDLQSYAISCQLILPPKANSK